MENKACNSCGGSLTRSGDYYVCDFCRSKWMIDASDDVHAVQRANAWDALRRGDFEKALELFEDIIVKDASSHEAYWGKALAENGIIYVTDYDENKKVPTCNNITEDSFLNNRSVKKAIELAPSGIKESYSKQAEQIERIRVEWLDKASKEPPYDIFLSYKDSDREHGINRTQDSVDVQDLYTALVAKGYNVFFSRVTLRDKVSEQYEPYIYNALKTAKVMIVFGEKAEYFNAVWVKNEWSRFKNRILSGEKHKNSLIVVYKNVDPYDIPSALVSGRQALDYSVPSNYEVLMNHIKRIVAESKQKVHLEKIEVKGGQIAKKSTQIQVETLQTREVGNGATAEVSISEKQMLSLAEVFINEDEWSDAKSQIDDVLFNNPNNAKALLYKLQIKYKAKSYIDVLGRISDFDEEAFSLVERILNSAGKEDAEIVLNILYKSGSTAKEEAYHRVLKMILPYNYEKRQENIGGAFECAIENNYVDVFNLLLTTLDEKEVDKYLQYNAKFLETAKDAETRKKICKNILSVDEGNKEALRAQLTICLDLDDEKGIKETFETILKYTKQAKQKEEVVRLLKQIDKKINSSQDCRAFDKVLPYFIGDIAEIKDLIIDVAYKCLRCSERKQAKRYFDLIVSIDENNPKIYWGYCLIKAEARDERETKFSDVLIKEMPEYRKCLTCANEEERKHYMTIAKAQVLWKEEYAKELANTQKREAEEQKRKEEAEKARREKVATDLAVAEAKHRVAVEQSKRQVLIAIVCGILGLPLFIVGASLMVPITIMVGAVLLTVAAVYGYKAYVQRRESVEEIRLAKQNKNELGLPNVKGKVRLTNGKASKIIVLAMAIFSFIMMFFSLCVGYEDGISVGSSGFTLITFSSALITYDYYWGTILLGLMSIVILVISVVIIVKAVLLIIGKKAGDKYEQGIVRSALIMSIVYAVAGFLFYIIAMATWGSGISFTTVAYIPCLIQIALYVIYKETKKRGM